MIAEDTMSNVKHPKCAIRNMANEAKSRLSSNDYSTKLYYGAPKNITPQQKEIYIKLCELKASGEEVVNPILQFADKEKLASLSHEERQRYIIQLSADYVNIKNLIEKQNSNNSAG